MAIVRLVRAVSAWAFEAALNDVLQYCSELFVPALAVQRFDVRRCHCYSLESLGRLVARSRHLHSDRLILWARPAAAVMTMATAAATIMVDRAAADYLFAAVWRLLSSLLVASLQLFPLHACTIAAADERLQQQC